AGTLAAQHDDNGIKQHGHIEPYRPVLDVFDVKPVHHGWSAVSARRGLPHAGYAGLYLLPQLARSRREFPGVVVGQWTWSSDCHFSAQHVPELGQFVDAQPPNKASDNGKDARVVAELDIL